MKSRCLMFRVVLACISLVVGLQVGCVSPDAGGPSAADAAMAAAPVDNARINTTYQPGDRIHIDFADNQGIPSNWQQTIREDGTITLPLSQTIRAAGMRKGELESAIQDLYV